MPSLDEKPTLEYIKQQAKNLKEVWRETHDQWTLCDTYYDRTFPLWPAGMDRPVVHPATPKSLIDTAVDQMMGHSPTFERFPRDISKKEQAEMGKL